MQPKDMAKKKFKLIPGADYTPLKHDTFGKFFGDYINRRNKSIADQLDFSKNPEGVIDFINPIRGSMQFVKGLSSIKPTRSVSKTRFEDPYFKQGVEDHINDKNRKAFADSEQRSYFEDLSPHMKPNHDGSEVYRGAIVTPDDEMMLLKEGDYFMSDRAMPFTRKIGVADAFASPTPQKPNGIFMNVAKPKSGIDMWSLRGNNAWDESEVTMPANVKYRIEAIYDKFINGAPRREMHMAEVATIPDGSRLLHYRSDKGTDYTNDELVKEQLNHLDTRIKNAEAKGLPKIKAIIQRQKDKFVSKYNESKLNKPKGAEGSSGRAEKFIPPRNKNFNDMFKVTERKPDVQGDLSNIDYLESLI